MFARKLLVIAGALLASCASISAVQITDCAYGEEGAAHVKSVTIKDCDLVSDEKCLFKRGTDANIVVDFVTTEPFQEAEVKMWGILGFIPIPFPVDPSEACGHYISCPARKGQHKTMNLTLPIYNTYLKVSATARFKLIDEQSRPILCVELPIKVVD